MRSADKSTIGIIYAIKKNKYEDYVESAIHFMMKYSDSPREAYTSYNITKIIERAFAEILNYVKYPSSIVFDYFRLCSDPWNYSHLKAMCVALDDIQVKQYNEITNKYEYINGFYPLEDFND